MKIAWTLVLLLLFCIPTTGQQARSFEIMNPRVYPGDTVIVRVEPQWQGPRVCIVAFGKEYALNPNGYVFIGTDLFTKPGKEQIFLTGCGLWVKSNTYLDEITVTEKIFPKTRIAKSGRGTGVRTGPQADAINYAFNQKNISLPDLTEGIAYIYPSDLFQNIIDPYGLIYSNNPTLPHYGVDLRMPVGTRIRATNKGIVALAAKNFRAEGNMIILNHGLGTFSVYMHLSRINVKEGEVVERGQVIGLSGKTGAGVKEPHLHFNIKIHDSYVDPLNFIETVNEVLK